jgi:hypothetical protein
VVGAARPPRAFRAGRNPLARRAALLHGRFVEAAAGGDQSIAASGHPITG